MPTDDQERYGESYGVAHWTGAWLRVGPRLRQRCAWCGAVMLDVDLSTIAFAGERTDVEPDDPTCGFPTWEPGTFVRHDGNMWVVVPAPPEDVTLPDSFCIALDPDLTGTPAW